MHALVGLLRAAMAASERRTPAGLHFRCRPEGQVAAPRCCAARSALAGRGAAGRGHGGEEYKPTARRALVGPLARQWPHERRTGGRRLLVADLGGGDDETSHSRREVEAHAVGGADLGRRVSTAGCAARPAEAGGSEDDGAVRKFRGTSVPRRSRRVPRTSNTSAKSALKASSRSTSTASGP